MSVPGRAVALRLRASEGLPLGAIFAAVGVTAGVAAALMPLDRFPIVVCYFKALTGLPCPTCGSTRALAELARLDLAGAFALNPLAVVAALAIAAWGLADLALLARQRALSLEVSPGLACFLRASAVAALVLNWAYLVLAGR